MLLVQYRMHPKVSRFPNESFYKGALKDDDSVKSRTSPWNEAHCDGRLKTVQQEYAVWDTSAETNDRYRDRLLGGGTSRYNLGEVDVVVGLLTLLNNTVRQKRSRGGMWSVFVLSPYEAQVSVCLCIFCLFACVWCARWGMFVCNVVCVCVCVCVYSGHHTAAGITRRSW